MIEGHLILIVVLLNPVLCAKIGDKCVAKPDNEIGTCQISCPKVQQWAKVGVAVTICDYDDVTPIFCCPNEYVEQVGSGGSKPQALSSNSKVNEQTDSRLVKKPQIQEKERHLRVSERKCVEYSKLFNDEVSAITLDKHSGSGTLTSQSCVYDGSPLIIGGTPAIAGEFPFMVAIGFPVNKDKWKCGGTLISDRFILTAAHCRRSGKIGSPTVVRLGELDFSKNGPHHQDYDILDIIIHPNNNSSEKRHDIALIKTVQTVKFTRFIKPACLYTEKNDEISSGLAIGWGRQGPYDEKSDRLLKVTLSIYDNNHCSRVYKQHYTRNIQTVLCAGELKGGMDTCEGDSGGPLLIKKPENPCNFHVIGITSYGKLCGLYNTPAVYTKVSNYIDWIEEVVW